MNPDDATHMNKWTLFPVAGNFGIGHSLGLLCLALLGHLDIAYVYPAKLQIYLNQMFLKSQPPRIDILNL
jgi:predicted lipase